jgi:hypothetical protein
VIPQLPLTLEPLRDEALPSILARASDLTGYPVRHLYPGDLRTLLDDPSADELRILGSVLGNTPAQLRRHTLKNRLRGQYDTLTPRDQRDAIGLRCPECGSSPLWSRLTLVTSCLECRLLLTRDDTRAAAPRQALAMQRAYVRGLCRPTRADTNESSVCGGFLSSVDARGGPVTGSASTAAPVGPTGSRRSGSRSSPQAPGR